MGSYLGKLVKVKMDRPLGSKPPKHNFIYPLNYAFIPNTTSGDGEEIDVYIIGEFDPLEEYVVAIIKITNDVEDKLVVCKELNKYNKEQIKALVEFQERFFESTIIIY
ncbi:Inorganic pyrophosphatase [Clostridium neonatale]|uniref:inorganic diphosphatase n=1 Tax=Clostridium neonatale TaxID=137838 RepID=UPI0012E422E2|nr:inorganic diphosphatase [Clostridium neonatale]SUQ48112.1 Inorganic pyrophosphatase [Clostridium neonatale]